MAHKIAAGEDGLVVKKEFKRLLYLIDWCNDVYKAFDAIDTSDDRRVDFEEFIKSTNGVLGLGLDDDELKAAFEEVDADGGGQILFKEFAEWGLKKKLSILTPPEASEYDFD